MIFNNVKVGTDPEVFLYNTKDKEFISAEGIIQGTKDKPYRITDIGHNVQLDNIMVEINVPPSKTPDELHRSIEFVLYYIRTKLPENTRISILPSAVLDEKYLQTEQAMMFGCEPDFDVWKMEVNTKPESEGGLRTAGGHIHIGYDKPDTYQSAELIKAMDLFLGVPSIFLDKDTERRKMYGNAGCFRICKYGVEYRTLSNFWIKNQNLTRWAYKGVNDAIDFLQKDMRVSEEDGELIRDAINSNNEEAANKLLTKHKIDIPNKRAKGYEKIVFA